MLSSLHIDHTKCTVPHRCFYNWTQTVLNKVYKSRLYMDDQNYKTRKPSSSINDFKITLAEWVSSCCFMRSRNCLPFASTWVHPRFPGGVRVALLFSCLCCPIVCLYILSSVLWCPLRFPHNTMFCSLLPPVVCRERIYHLRYIVSLRIVVSNTYCDLFLFCFLRLVFPILPVSLDCQFLIAPSVFSNIYILTNLTIRLYIIFYQWIL
jgi:hypothetical protein